MKVFLSCAIVAVSVVAARLLSASWFLSSVAGTIALLVIVGVLLVRSEKAPGTRSTLGAGLLVSAVVSIGIAAAQLALQDANQRAANEQSLRLTLALQSNLAYIDLRYKNIDGFYLRGKNLRGAELAHVEARQAILVGANLSGGADLANANLEGAQLRQARLSGSYLEHADLHGATLIESDATGADFGGATLTNTTMTSADLTGSQFNYADLTLAQMQRCVMNGASFQHATMRYTALYAAQLNSADLYDADLEGADLHNADLRGAVLLGANLHGAKLTGAVYDSRTQWPHGFRFSRTGARNSRIWRPPGALELG
jgi:uncharacterized protein YjbI with pentapeptide repeats